MDSLRLNTLHIVWDLWNKIKTKNSNRSPTHYPLPITHRPSCCPFPSSFLPVCNSSLPISPSITHTGAVIPSRRLQANIIDLVSRPPLPVPRPLQNQSRSPTLSNRRWYTPPGAGVNQSLSNTNRTLWPLTGGSVVLHVSHPWAITYVNLGLGGDNTTVFNISLVPNFNQTGNGTFCLPAIKLPKDVVVSNGTQASLQVIQIGETGSSLYNVNSPPPTSPPPHLKGPSFYKVGAVEKKKTTADMLIPPFSVRGHHVQLGCQDPWKRQMQQLHRCRWSLP